MENFDFEDLLKNGLSQDHANARFEFKEEYWLQAKALLDADAARRKRKRALGYAFVLTILLVPAATFYMQRHHKAIPPQPAPAPTSVAPATDIAANHTDNALASPLAPADNASFGQNEKIVAPKATNAANFASTIQTPSIEQSTAKTTTNTLLQSTGLSANDNRLPQINQIENATTSGGLPITTQAVPQGISIAAYKPDQKANDRTPSFLYRNTLAPLPNAIAAPKSMADASAPVLSHFQIAQAVEEDNPTSPITRKHDDKPLETGLVASLSTPSGLFFQERPGTALGLTARYRIFKNIYLNADLLWRRNSGNQNIGAYAVSDQFNASGTLYNTGIEHLVDQAIATNYSFGYTNTQISDVTRSIHQIELPLSIQYQWRRFALESGVSFATRLLSRKVTEETQQTSLMPGGSIQQKSAYYEPYGGQNLQTSLIGGLHWQPLKHWRFGCRVNWSLADNAGLRFKSNGYNNDYQKTELLVSKKRIVGAELRTSYLF
jgi:hypothetical protein